MINGLGPDQQTNDIIAHITSVARARDIQIAIAHIPGLLNPADKHSRDLLINYHALGAPLHVIDQWVEPPRAFAITAWA